MYQECTPRANDLPNSQLSSEASFAHPSRPSKMMNFTPPPLQVANSLGWAITIARETKQGGKDK